MWATVTLAPTFLPQSWAKGRNHWSWLGTKWLQSRILRSPESLVLGSGKLTDGAWTAAFSPPPPPPPSRCGGCAGEGPPHARDAHRPQELSSVGCPQRG